MKCLEPLEGELVIHKEQTCMSDPLATKQKIILQPLPWRLSVRGK
jgi:hypothetical protein